MTVLCARNALPPDIHMTNFSTFSKSLFKPYLLSNARSSHYPFTHALIHTLTQLNFLICFPTVFYHLTATLIHIKFYYGLSLFYTVCFLHLEYELHESKDLHPACSL